MHSLTIRPAQPEDKVPVAQLCALIWDGEDYVPEVFDEWVADPKGEFTVAFEGTELVGLGKLTELSPDEWWLEGLRVHPSHRGRGLARALHEYAVNLADRVARGVLRFTTEGGNTPVHALAARSGFELVSQHYVARADAAGGPGGQQFRAAVAGDLPALHSRLALSATFAGAGGLMEDGWGWSSLRPQLDSLVRAGRVLWWDRQEEAAAGLAVINERREEGETRFWVNYADAIPGDWEALWLALRHLAAERGWDTLRAKPLAGPDMAAALTEAGWELEPDHTMWVYERRLPGRPAPD